MTAASTPYAASLTVDYPERLDRLSTFLRALCAVPIFILLSLLTATGNETFITETGETLSLIHI